MGSSVPNGANPLPALSERRAAPSERAQEIVGGEDELVQVRVRVAAIDEPFAPVAGGQLAAGRRHAFEVEHAREPKPSQGPGVQVQSRLDHAQLRQRAAAGHGVGLLECDDRPGAEP